ncbi:unnamed protein product [Peniophora sp. CBMAI 1063]|nr:unnamed protein product [Peniophora sp. CBMAI 1063]
MSPDLQPVKTSFLVREVEPAIGLAIVYASIRDRQAVFPALHPDAAWNSAFIGCIKDVIHGIVRQHLLHIHRPGVTFNVTTQRQALEKSVEDTVLGPVKMSTVTVTYGANEEKCKAKSLRLRPENLPEYERAEAYVLHSMHVKAGAVTVEDFVQAPDMESEKEYLTTHPWRVS